MVLRLSLTESLRASILAELRKKIMSATAKTRQTPERANGRHSSPQLRAAGCRRRKIRPIRGFLVLRASLIVETISRTFVQEFHFFQRGFGAEFASVTCRGSFSNARKSAYRVFPLGRSWRSG